MRGLSAAADDAHNPRSIFDFRKWARRRDRSRELHPRDVGGPPSRGRVDTDALQQIGAVDARSGNLDYDFVCNGLGSWAVAHLEAPVFDDHRSHCDVST
jgi:hypothetical protein